MVVLDLMALSAQLGNDRSFKNRPAQSG